MYSYKNIKNSAFQLYKSAYGIYVLKLIENGNLFKSKVIVEVSDIFGNRFVISKLDLMNNYVDHRFKKIKMHRLRHNVCYLVLRKGENYVYGCYIADKVRINSKFRQFSGRNDNYVVCGVTENNTVDRTMFTSMDKRLFRSLFKHVKNSMDLRLSNNNNFNKGHLDTKPLIDKQSIIVNQQDVAKQQHQSMEQQVEVSVRNRLIDGYGNLVGFRLYDKGGNVLNLTIKELISLCENRGNTKLTNVSVRKVDGKKHLYGIGISLKELPAIRV